MKLRKLLSKDADRMLEWMHDPFVVGKLRTNFKKKTKDECESFINNSQDEDNIHLAIVDDEDTYMGTVSLKHITRDSAEFAIVVHRDAMGKGYSIWAMKEILKLGFERYKVKDIYWCVAKDNIRALIFYDKNGFERVNSEELDVIGGYTDEQLKSYIWYLVTMCTE